MTVPEISVHQLQNLLNQKADIFLLDVREPHEYQICHLQGHLIPLKELPDRLSELNRDQEIIVHCRSGGRSRHAAEFLLQQGFTKVSNLTGGILAWAKEIDLSMRQY